jgi:hypothetical protein
MKSQFVTSRENTFFSGQGGGRRKYPYAFTEQGLFKNSNNPCYPKSFIIQVETIEAA